MSSKPHLWLERGLWRCRSVGKAYVGRTRELAYLEWLTHSLSHLDAEVTA